jgi:hypothetical protein
MALPPRKPPTSSSPPPTDPAIADLQNRVTVLEGKVTTLESTTSDQATQIAALDTRVTMLEQVSTEPPVEPPIEPPVEPPIEPPPTEGPSKDFVRDFGAPTDGTTNCKPAMDNWLTWARTQTNPTLIIDGAGGKVFQTSTCLFSKLVSNATIKGINGAVITNLNIGTPDAFPMQMNRGHRSAIRSATAGNTTITLINAGDASKYVVGQWCLVGGWEAMTDGSYPSALRFFEYRKITAINGAVLTLDRALTQDYLSTWPIEPKNQDGPASVYGIGGIYCDPACTPEALAACMEGTITVKDLKMAKGFSSWLAGTALFNNIDMSEATGPSDSSTEAFSPSICRKFVFTNCKLPGSCEVDKCIDVMEFHGCSGTPGFSLRLQSNACNSLVIKDCSFGKADAGGLGGSGINTTVENSTLGQLWAGPTDFGRANSLTLTNVTMLGPWAVGIGCNAPPLSAFENRGNTGTGLLLRLAKNNPLFSQYAPAPLSRMISGHAMALGYMPGGGPPNITPDGGQSIVNFRILSAYEDANYFYWQTDLTSIPARTYSGQAPNMTWHYPLNSYSGPTPPANYFVSPFASRGATRTQGRRK